MSPESQGSKIFPCICCPPPVCPGQPAADLSGSAGKAAVIVSGAADANLDRQLPALPDANQPGRLPWTAFMGRRSRRIWKKQATCQVHIFDG
jgi:hypothetical protein